MPGASHPGVGTDKTKNWIDTPGPIIILVKPPLGENIGAGDSVAACRAQQGDRVRRIGFLTSSSESGSEIEALPPDSGEGFKNSAGERAGRAAT